MPENRPAIGGSAAMEGVMMKGPRAWALAVRRSDGSIYVETHPSRPLKERLKAAGWPLLRGIFVLGESLAVSYQSLSRSAEVLFDDERRREAAARGQPIPLPRQRQSSLWWVMLLSLVLAIGFMKILPVALTGTVISQTAHPYVFNLVEGLVRFAIVLGYIVAIGRLPDMQRFFRYHGAEHQAIKTWEAGEELTVANAAKYDPIHPRCGTSFLVFVMLVSVLFYTLLGRQQELWWRLLSRVVFLPVIAAIAYEFIYLTARYDNALTRILRRPGMWTQRLTAWPPTADMLEVALVSVRAALGLPQAERQEAVARA
ncbi:MAG: DUF1385 domain-containing protein [Deinococcus sp.]|nr:DUF1385 domain-containing protein [Deinococcus sp.]